MTSFPMKRLPGRPPGDPAKRAETIKRYRATHKNITVDADLVGLIGKHADRLEPTLGFRPTISQTLRYVLKKAL